YEVGKLRFRSWQLRKVALTPAVFTPAVVALHSSIGCTDRAHNRRLRSDGTGGTSNSGTKDSLCIVPWSR
ncbi:hypothetical protein N9B60_07080, partial [Mariniblastus sp.]|nr:hypothetical protein [Mariniblastus sp.]